MGWGRIVLAESPSRLYPHMRAKFGRDPTAVSKKVPFNFISRYTRYKGWVTFLRQNIGLTLDNDYIYMPQRRHSMQEVSWLDLHLAKRGRTNRRRGYIVGTSLDLHLAKRGRTNRTRGYIVGTSSEHTRHSSQLAHDREDIV